MRIPSNALMLALLLIAVFVSESSAQDGGTVKVFILAGQSNMEGKAPNKLLEHQATDEETKQL